MGRAGREGREGGERILFVEGEGGRQRLATIERAGRGDDDVGEFSGQSSEKELVDAGVGFPPYHGLCRSTTIPVFE